MAKKQLLDLSGLTYYTDKIQSWVVANSVQSVDVGSGLTKTGSDEQHPVISLSLADYTFLSASTAVTGDTVDRTYAVGLDSSGKLAVNVPWEGGEDEKVRQSLGEENVNYPILFSASEDPSGDTEEALYDAGFKINPNKHSIMEGSGTVASGNYSHAEGYAPGSEITDLEITITEIVNISSHGFIIDKAYKTSAAHGLQEGNYVSINSDGSSSVVVRQIDSSTQFRVGNLTMGVIPNASVGSELYLVVNNSTIASGEGSHAEGYGTKAYGDYSHTEGVGTITNNEAEHAEGYYNKTLSVSLHTVGIGFDESSRSNAHLITIDGLHYIPGIGGYEGDEDDNDLDNVEDLATVINRKQNELIAGDGIDISGDTISSTGNKTPITSITPTSTTTIDPYIMYNLGTVSSAITIVFNTSAEVAGYCAEYLIKFVAGNDCSITLPSGTKYNGGSAPTYVSGRYYEINICNGLAVVGEFY